MSRRGGDVAIVGMACRFPGATDLVAFWENILGGVDATTAVPPDRWDPATFFDPPGATPRRGGYLAGPIPFDPRGTGSCRGRSRGASPSSSSSSTPPAPPCSTPACPTARAIGGGWRSSSRGGTTSTGAT